MTNPIKTLTLRSPVAASVALPVQKTDRLLVGDKGGVRFLVDGAHPLSWPKNAAPVTGDTMVDLSGHANGIWGLGAGTIGYGGNGFDFTGEADKFDVGLFLDNNLAASVWGTGVEDQFFLLCAYVLLPAEADWHTDVNTVTTIISGAHSTAIASNMAFGGFSMHSSGLAMLAYSTTGAATNNISRVIVPPAHAGRLAQYALIKDATNFRTQLRTSEGVLLNASGGVGTSAKNTNNFSANAARVGRVGGFTGGSQDDDSHKFKLYRAFGENLRISGRNPEAVLAADWARAVARGYA